MIINRIARLYFFSACLLLPAQAEDLKVAAIDIARVFSNSRYIADTYMQLQTEQSAINRLIATADAEVAELKASGDKEKLEKRYAEIQTLLDTQVKKFHINSETTLAAMKERVDNTIKAFAEKQGYQIVLDKAFTAGEGPHELSDEVIKALDLKAEKSPASK